MDDSATQSKYEELVKKYKSLRKQLISIVEEKEYLIKHRFYNLRTEYIKKIGYLEYELYELDVKLSQANRRIELVKNALDANVPINLSQIELEITKEFGDFIDILELRDKEILIYDYINNIEKNLSEDEFLELRKYYRRTIKVLHPRIHSNLTELQKKLWTKANLAYENGGLIYLKIIYKLAHDEYVNMPKLEEYSIEELKSRVKLIEDNIKESIFEIKEIKEGFPFNKEVLLKDEVKVKDIQKELKRNINEAKSILELLEQHFLLLLNERHYIN
jgi:hypothetical protein